MKKTKMILACLVVAAALGGLTGCMFPEYGLEFDFYPTYVNYGGDPGTQDVQIECRVTNSGSQSVANVMVHMDIEMIIGGIDDYWFTIGDLNPGESGSAYITYIDDDINDDPRVIEVLWDTAE